MRPLKPDPLKDPTLDFEREFLGFGDAPCIIGLDEAGRGALAGPVAVGAHVYRLSDGDFPEGLRDSKLLSEKRREAMYDPVAAWGTGAVGLVSAGRISRDGITASLASAARQALLELHEAGVPVTDALILLDGSHDWLSSALKRPLRVETRVGADRSHAVVAAASLRAKVLRDRLMLEHAVTHPHYGWEKNKGYGAKAHLDGIREHGITELHRESWIKV